MDASELLKLANANMKDDPNTAIVLMVLSACKEIKLDGYFAKYCQEYSRSVVHEFEVGNLTDYILAINGIKGD